MSSALVFGGTFDPVHNGHLAVARQARLTTGVDSVWFVPAALAPLRDPPHATPEQRFELLVAARDGGREVGMDVLDVALRLGGISYTAGVMDALRDGHPGVELTVLIGADAARTIDRWHRSDDLLGGERFVIVNRTGTPPLHLDERWRAGLRHFPYDRACGGLAGYQRLRGARSVRPGRVAHRAGPEGGRRAHREERNVPRES